jgi:hypothetical protein
MAKPLLPKGTLSLVAETNRQKIGLQQPPNRPYFQRMSFGSLFYGYYDCCSCCCNDEEIATGKTTRRRA